MLAKLSSYTLVGIDAATVEVEGDVSPASMPKTVLVGLAEAAVRESTHRVERALVNSGYRRPIDRIVINLAPADLKEDAGGFDLPIALGMLLGSGQVAFERKGDFAVVVETQGFRSKLNGNGANRWELCGGGGPDPECPGRAAFTRPPPPG
jgi:magnesium chelatase family protein